MQKGTLEHEAEGVKDLADKLVENNQWNITVFAYRLISVFLSVCLPVRLLSVCVSAFLCRFDAYLSCLTVWLCFLYVYMCLILHVSSLFSLYPVSFSVSVFLCLCFTVPTNSAVGRLNLLLIGYVSVRKFLQRNGDNGQRTVVQKQENQKVMPDGVGYMQRETV